MSFALGSSRNKEDKKYSHNMNKSITDKGDLEEINKIKEMLNPDEIVLLVQDNQK